MSVEPESTEQASEQPPLLTAPRTELPALIVDESGLIKAVSALSAGSGDIALDAERASGYRYSQRAYLIQIFRRGGGLHLVDPTAFAQEKIAKYLAPLNELLQSATAVIHASSQDLPCLRNVGLEPTSLFDTELAARIAGFPRVGLGALTESLLHLRLAKEHSAVDWSLRPLHQDWLIYAALDVDVLLDLKDEIVRVLTEREKLQWALEESEAALWLPPPSPKPEPWRRTSGIHQVKKNEQLAVIRELWKVRDQLARERDIAAGRLLHDRSIISCATKTPSSLLQLSSMQAFKKDAPTWWSAIEAARANSTLEKPPPSDGPPTQIRIWRERAPKAYARLTHAKARLLLAAEQAQVPVENLLSPEAVRRFCWQDPPAETSTLSQIESFLADRGARTWQIALTAALLQEIESEVEPLAKIDESPLTSESPDLESTD